MLAKKKVCGRPAVNNITVKEMKRLNKEAGYTFFSRSTMEEFKRKIEVSPDSLGYFIISEENKFGNLIFSIRLFDCSTGKVRLVESDIWSKEEAKIKCSRIKNELHKHTKKQNKENRSLNGAKKHN